MTIVVHGGGGGGAAGSQILQPHSEIISGGATWHWPLTGSSGVESVVGGGALDLTGTLSWEHDGPGDSVGCLRAGLSTVPDTGAIGAAVQIQTAITVAAWIRRYAAISVNTTICGARIPGAGSANNIQWELGIDTTEKVRAIWQDGGADNTNIAQATVASAVDTWEHWCFTRPTAGTSAKLYKNGVLDGTETTGLNKATGGSNVTAISVGVNSTAGNEYEGTIFSAIVYEEELSAAQVLELYNSTSSTGTW